MVFVLNAPKCVVSRLAPGRQRYRNIISVHPDARDVKLPESGTTLWIEVGPGGRAQQRETVTRKSAAMIPGVSGAPSLVERVVRFTSYNRVRECGPVPHEESLAVFPLILDVPPQGPLDPSRSSSHRPACT